MAGQTVSHFEILEKLGEGGMGVVYKARDTQLGRIVAVKVLPSERVADVERRKRFVQEARAASALNHPNIVTIHEIFQANGTDYIVMEFVAGKTLDHIITRRGLRVPEALKYSVQIADALAKAHQAGIVHRDLKPANIMVSDDGRVKVLDFGLAKLTEPASTSGESQTTVTRPMSDGPQTEEGAVIGTVAYMSPEQAEGRTVDARTDIFSFGAVLYEMLSGHRAFQGPSKMATLASVMREEPKALGELSPAVPRDLEKLVSRCLRKDPERRAQHMSDLKLALEELKEESESGHVSGTSSARLTPPAPKRIRWWIPAVGGLFIITAAAAVLLRRETPAAAPALKLVTLTSYPGVERQPALSPDGRQVAFSWDGDTGDNLDLYVKLVDAGTPVRLTNTPQHESGAAWSPDGRFIAFARFGPNAAPGAYFVIPALGGTERKIADIPRVPSHQRFPRVDWSGDGKGLVIMDAAIDPPALAIVSLDTLEKKPLTRPPANSMGDIRPRVAPDGKRVAFVRALNVTAFDWFLVPIDGSEEPKPITRLRAPMPGGTWTPDGTELVISTSIEGVFRLVRTKITGSSPIVRIPEVGTDVFEPSFARQGGRLAYETGYADGNLWKVNLRDARAEPIRVFGSTKFETQPDFSPDGSKLAFISGASGDAEVWTANADGSNPTQVTNGSARPTAPRWSPDGKKLAFAKRPGGNTDVYIVDAVGGAPRRLTTDPGNDASAYWSRDGKWIYFASNRTGRMEVWKIASDGAATEVQVTKNGGWRSRESLDGRTLYYQKLDAPGLWRMTAAGGPEEKVADIAAGYTWDAPGREIVYLDGPVVSRLDPATGRIAGTRKLQSVAGGTNNLAVSSDGQWLVYIRVDHRVDDLMLIENFR